MLVKRIGTGICAALGFVGTYTLLNRPKNKHKIYLFERVCMESSLRIIQELHESRMPIELIINSDGGDLISAFAIIDAMAQHKHPIHTIIMGRACSAAALIAVSANERSMSENACIMFHDPYFPNNDSSSKLIWYDPVSWFNSKSKEVPEEIVVRARKIIFKNSSVSDVEYSVLQNKYIYLKEAMRLGLIDTPLLK
jgi:membrane-bound ClpP family serine protease